jgi:hypothetical protein
VGHSSLLSRIPSSLSESINQQLKMYALAAGAAGVGALALAQPSEAKIVYTPANKIIPNKVVVNLDLNHDGSPDFYFYFSATIFRGHRPPSPFGGAELWITPVQEGNQISGTGTLRKLPNASALPTGARIGSRRKFSPGKHLMATTNYGCSTTCNGSSNGQWKEASRRYLGLKFIIKGQIHYGWARLTVDADWGHEGIHATLTGYAYETVPNKPIIAGKTKGLDDVSNVEQPDPGVLHAPALKPASLGLLAIGAPALPIWRREDSLGAQ